MTATHKLAIDNMALVHWTVTKLFRNPHAVLLKMGRDDAVAAGMVGLVKAANTFRPELGFSFSTYAGHCIWREVIMQACKYAELPLPTGWERRNNKYAEQVSRAVNGVQPSDEGWFEPTCRNDPVTEVVHRDETAILRRHMAELPPMELDALDTILSNKTLMEKGREMGRTKERVRQLRCKAIGRLRRAYERTCVTAEAMT